MDVADLRRFAWCPCRSDSGRVWLTHPAVLPTCNVDVDNKQLSPGVNDDLRGKRLVCGVVVRGNGLPRL